MNAMKTLLDEGPISPSQAARSLPKINGHQPHPTTIWRWARRGISGVRLEHGFLGRRMITSHAALARFAEQVAAAKEFPAPVPARHHGPSHAGSRPAKQREREIKAASEACKAAGI